MELIRGRIKVEFEDIGEGLNGDYDSEDPEDQSLYRFYVSVLMGEDWESVDDASYCTNVPTDTSEEDLKQLLIILMDHYWGALNNKICPGHELPSVKKLGEELSWISPEWVEGVRPA